MSEADQPEIAREDSVNVSSGGRVTIPSYIRDEYGLVRNQLVQIRLIDQREVFNATLQPKGRVRIPKRIRDEHGIEDGDTVDIEIKL